MLTRKGYCAVIVGAMLATLGALALTASRVPPFIGDLTRVGGLSENLYGWTLPQKGFGEPLYHYVHSYDELLDSKSSIIVFGDSFSAPRDDHVGTWVDFMNNHLNEDVTVFHYQNIGQLYNFLESSRYTINPPKALILENVTRNFVWQVVMARCPSIGSLPPQPHPGFVRSPGRKPLEIERRTSYRGIHEALGVASYFLGSAARRHLVPIGNSVVESELLRPDLFSSSSSATLLSYVTEVGAMGATAPEIEKTICTLRYLQARATRNGRTAFFFVPIPDKSVAYRDYVADGRFHIPPGYTALRQTTGLGWLDSLAIIDLLIRQGTKDVYLPNDTHFGAPAAKAVGDAVAVLLAGQNARSVADQ